MKQLKDMVEGVLDVDDLDMSVEQNVSQEFDEKIQEAITFLAFIVQDDEACTEAEADRLKNLIEAGCAVNSNPISISKKLRQKDNTALIYFEKHPEIHDEAIEIRAFVKNPRPFVCLIGRNKNINRWTFRSIRSRNHFTQIPRDVLKRIMFLGPEVWNEIIGPYNKFYLR